MIEAVGDDPKRLDRAGDLGPSGEKLAPTLGCRRSAGNIVALEPGQGYQCAEVRAVRMLLPLRERGLSERLERTTGLGALQEVVQPPRAGEGWIGDSDRPCRTDRGYDAAILGRERPLGGHGLTAGRAQRT